MRVGMAFGVLDTVGSVDANHVSTMRSNAVGCHGVSIACNEMLISLISCTVKLVQSLQQDSHSSIMAFHSLLVMEVCCAIDLSVLTHTMLILFHQTLFDTS